MLIAISYLDLKYLPNTMVIYEFARAIYEFELGNSDFQTVWNAA